MKPKITVQNIVASGTINLKLNLNFLALEMENTEYEPEQFPGAIFRLDEPKLTMLLFKNGKMIAAGAKEEALLKKGLNKASRILKALREGKKPKDQP